MQGELAFPILEAAYNFSDCKEEVLRTIAKAAMKIIPRGPIAVCTYNHIDGLPDLRASYFERADNRYLQIFDEGARTIPVAVRRSFLSLPPTVIDLRSKHVDEFPPHIQAQLRERIPLSLLANTGDGGGISIAFGDRSVSEWPLTRIHHFNAVAQHLSAAWRLRASLTHGDAPPTIAAELRLDGTAICLTQAASRPTAREALRRAVFTRERSRSKKTGSDYRLWPALVAGRWSLVDVFSAAGTRYVVAYENPMGSSGLRALTQRELIVLEYALAGRSGKWIALELGLSEPTVTRAIRAALRRIGVPDTAALAGVVNALFEPLEGINVEGALALACLKPAVLSAASLSLAERAIVAAILSGKRIAAIARERRTSVRTVAHQTTSIYRKLGVSSRGELLAATRLPIPT